MAQTSERDALRIIGLAYDTAMSRENWSGFMGNLIGCVDGRSGMLRMVDYTSRQVGFFDTAGYNPGLPQAYREHYIDIDPYRRAFEVLPAGKLVTADEFMGAAQRRKGEFYHEYERPNDVEYLAGAVLVRNDSYNIQVGIHRSMRVGDFGRDTLDFIELLLPHLVRAMQVRLLIENSTRQQLLAQEALDRLRLGVAIVDAQGRLIFANRAAERLMDASRGALGISMRTLRLQDPKDAALMLRLVAEASATTVGKGASTGGEMRIRCGDGEFLQLCITPLSRYRIGCEFAAPAACAAVFMCRPGSAQLQWRRVAQIFGLSQAEARLAVRLAGGASLEKAVLHMGISIHTARSQLKSIFSKTGCRRQAELVALLLQGALAVCDVEEHEP